PDAPSPAGTAVCLPGGVDGSGMFRYLRDWMRVTFAGGQDPLEGKIIRVAHLGDVRSFGIVNRLAALEPALRPFGAPVRARRGDPRRGPAAPLMPTAPWPIASS